MRSDSSGNKAGVMFNHVLCMVQAPACEGRDLRKAKPLIALEHLLQCPLGSRH